MDVETTDDVDAFLQVAGPFVAEREAENNLLLGVVGTIRSDPSLYPDRRFWIVRHGGAIAGAALRTAPYNLIVPRIDEPGAVEVLAGEVRGEALPGVVGLLPEVEVLARAVEESASPVLRQGVFALERVEPTPQAPGAARPAGDADRELVLGWWLAFAAEALPASSPSTARTALTVDSRLRGRSSGIFLWEDGDEVVSFAAWGGPTPNGIRIGPVYTPPPLRGRGYATALVAELTQRLLDGSLDGATRRYCFLYTDLANPTSNAIYERIGYVRVADAAEYAFARPKGV